jgi:HEAT repeat protein
MDEGHLEMSEEYDTARDDDTSLRKLLRLVWLGLVLLGLVAFPGVASPRPPLPPKSCPELLLGEHPEISEAEYLDVVKDKSHDYQLRECAGMSYAMRHPESVKEFIELLDNDRYTTQIAIKSLRSMGSSARPAVPFLLDSEILNLYRNYDSPLTGTLRNIGIVDRESIDKLLDMAIMKRPDRAITDLSVKILSSQKTLPAYVGDVVIAELDKNEDTSGKSFNSPLYQILIPVRTPQAVERYVEMVKKFVVKSDFLDDGYSGSQLGIYFSKFNEIGIAVIPALIDNFRKHDDLDSRAFSIILLMKMKIAESTQAGARLALEMIVPLQKDWAAVESPVVSGNASLKASIARIRLLGDMVQSLGKELLVLLEHADETQIRLDLIRALQEIKYTDALPTLRRLADEDHDAKVRSAAMKYVEALEDRDSCHEVLEAHPEIPKAEYFEVLKDNSRYYRLRVCVGEWYAMQHPESFEEFIKLIFDREPHANTTGFAIRRLERMGPQARPAVPFLISALDSVRNGSYADYLKDALISIGVVDRESIDKLLDLAITNRVWKDTCRDAVQVLANQKTLPAQVGDVVISRIDKGDNCASLYPILIPVRTPKAIERYIKWTKESVVQPSFLDYQPEIGDFKYAFQKIGPAAIPALVDNFRKSKDLDSKAFSVMTLMTMRTVESMQAGRKLAREMLSPPKKPAVTNASAPNDPSSRDEAESRARKLEGMVQLLGRELLVYLYLTDDAPMRLELIGALRDLRYTDALPALRRLAGEDREIKVRAEAVTSVAVLEKALEDAADTP